MGTSSKRQSTLTRYFMKFAVVLAAWSVLSFSVAADSEIKTIYHVYVDDELAGVVTDQKVIEDEIAKTLKAEQEKHPEFELEVQNTIEFIPEQVFLVRASEDKAVKYVQDNTEIQAKAIAIKNKDKVLTYVKDKKAAEELLEALANQYLTKDEVKALNTAKQSKEKQKPLTKEGSQVLSAEIQEELTTEAANTTPKEILDVKNAVSYLNKGTLEEKKHSIASGEVLGKIAAQYDLTTKELIKLNDGMTEKTVLQIGDELTVTVTNPHVHVIVEKEEYKEEIIDYEIETIENDSLPKGETKVKQEGKEGKKAITYKVTEKSGKETERKVEKEVDIEKPVKKIIEKGTKEIVQTQQAPATNNNSTSTNSSNETKSSSQPSRGSGSLAWPASGGYVSSGVGNRWGSMHKGIDIARPSNRTIKAADSGVIVSAGWDGGYGNKIVIDHQNGMRTIYAHLDSINVSSGQSIGKGQSIGVMGSTGNSTGVHLHFEVYVNGALKNGLDYF